VGGKPNLGRIRCTRLRNKVRKQVGKQVRKNVRENADRIALSAQPLFTGCGQVNFQMRWAIAKTGNNAFS
jgi:hypothetical protein